MAEMARGAGAEVLLVTNCVPGEMADPIRRASRRTGARLLDTEALLESWVPRLESGEVLATARAGTLARYGERILAENPELEVYLSDGCHPNPVGQRILAMALAGMVEETAGFPAPSP
jgi:lysophospholipase L1-like esterase